MARNLTLGHAGIVELTVERDGAALRLQPERIALDILDRRAGSTHDLPGETFQLLSKDVAYVKLSSVLQKDASDYIERAAGTKVLVVDLRNYPSQFMVFAMGSHLVSQTTGFVRFTFPVVESPGSFVMSPVLTLRPASPQYTGKVVILVDETTQSQAEYTAMAFRSAPNSLVVGSTTAGADGNVSPIILPGGLRTAISGIGVLYPDGTPTQRVGIVPDLVVLPTIEGIRQGRDEVLEAAVSRALGREFRLDR
jgi:C-terminal processing protease CtpA/Prc